MATATVPAGDGFRIGMLLSDTRYRGITLQVIALFVLMLVFAWLVDNTVKNLAALGKDFSFGFLWQPSGYDINQHMIDYSSRSSNARAALVGILNTLLVAVLGCITATVLGVFAGVLRLSQNWLIARLMTVYIETFRNVPVLIWILITAAVVNEFFPSPREFRLDADGNAAASPYLGGALVLTNRGIYAAAPVFHEGSGIVIWGLVAAIVIAILFGRWARRRQEETGEILPTGWIRSGIILGIPLVLFFIAGMPISLEYPELKGFNFQGGIYGRDSLIALWLALSVYTGAFIAESVRAGILAVSKGQTEAASALGLRPGRTMQLVILPQALRVIIPPLISQYLNLTKNSSLAIAVG
ncbi:MAG: ABC transporter permease subunit, partial [Geminicoccaceae bacterium]|nr:ABC transporter permease subunit [Geminicoccaceae bacterium]